ncbi:MAG: S1C family serine protease, partial [Terriglobales bacterium]
MKLRSTLALALILAGGLWFYAALRSGAIYPGLMHGRAVALAEAPAQSSYQPEETRDIEIYHKVSRSVVNITSQIIQYNLLWGPVPASGQGSGFFINKDGYILTNYHVIAGARRLTVTWTPSKDKPQRFPATVVGQAPELDLAVIKIQAQAELPPVTLGDSGNLQVGQRVLAIGNPYGLPGTMTEGIISSIRTVQE